MRAPHFCSMSIASYRTTLRLPEIALINFTEDEWCDTGDVKR